LQLFGAKVCTLFGVLEPAVTRDGNKQTRDRDRVDTEKAGSVVGRLISSGDHPDDLGLLLGVSFL
jgi:hypothetical protein